MSAEPPPDWVLTRRRAVGDHIRDARLWRNLTQQALAERAGIDRQAIGLMEAGRVSPRLDTLLVIADALGTPLADLVRE